MHDLIDFLERKQWIWAGREQRQPIYTHSSGHQLLDDKLEGGFPHSGVVTIKSATGIGELRFLLPYLQQEKRLIVFINPPGIICADFLHCEGVNLQHVLIIQTQEKNEALWAAEQCLKSGTCHAVLLWQNAIEIHQAKRLQIACETGSSIQFLFQPLNVRDLSLPVALALQLMPGAKGVDLTIKKRKGGWPIAEFSLDMSSRWPELTFVREGGHVIPFPKKQAM